MTDDCVDAVVIGAGVVGLAVARALAVQGHEVVVLERAATIGSETSARNSEVIHAGIYYPPDSAKAALCVRGKTLLYQYLQEHNLPFQRCGKLIVAVDSQQRAELDQIESRALAAGVQDLQRLSATEVAELEPQVRSVEGLLSPSTGIIDSHQYMLQLQADLEAHGGIVALNSAVHRGGRDADGCYLLQLQGAAEPGLRSRLVINCAGLWAREVLATLLPDNAQQYLPEQHYAIGHYYSYPGNAPFARLVYPTPSPGGLGIHATIDLGGQVRFGPDVRWIDTLDYSFDDSQREAFAQSIQRYFPALEPERLQPGYTGIRPKLAPAGKAASDFVMLGPKDHGVDGLVSLHGIESPGLTASLAVAQRVVQML